MRVFRVVYIPSITHHPGESRASIILSIYLSIYLSALYDVVPTVEEKEKEEDLRYHDAPRLPGPPALPIPVMRGRDTGYTDTRTHGRGRQTDDVTGCGCGCGEACRVHITSHHIASYCLALPKCCGPGLSWTAGLVPEAVMASSPWVVVLVTMILRV